MKRSKIVRFLVASVLVMSLATMLSGCSQDDFDPTAEGQEAVTALEEEDTTNEETDRLDELEDATAEISTEEQLQMFKQQQMLRMSQIHRRCMQPIPRLYKGRVIIN